MSRRAAAGPAPRRLWYGLSTLALSATLLSGCLPIPQSGDRDETVTATASPTAIPMLEIMTPTPGVPPPAATAEAGADSESGASGIQGSTYRVMPGDTLYGIAVKLGVSPDALADANGITDPHSLQVGQILTVP